MKGMPMAETARHNQNQGAQRPPQRESLVFSPVTGLIRLVFSCFGWFLFSVMAGAFVDWLGMLAGWWGRDHATAVLTQDILWLGENFTSSLFGVPPAELALGLSKTVHHYLSFGEIRLYANDTAFLRIVKSAALSVQPYWEAVILSAMSTVVRVFILCLSAVFYLIVFVVTMIDGLVERELRKEGGGIEHAAVFHHARIWVSRPLAYAPIVYLACPVSINPSWVVMPSALMLGMATYFTFFTFRKHV